MITPSATLGEKLRERGTVKCQGRGRSRIRSKRVVGDKGCTGHRIRNYLHCRAIRLTIPRLSNEPPLASFNGQIYRQRNIVESTINRLKQFRRIATRDEKLAAN
ncbi:transposase [Microcoleus sp. FACHB-672]|uniref:transposase n=1 Tax=Microcoleus sp. FACHB-672 TaxID=2692825 RepID=UPI00168971AB|nr:transposase [Microcoleus sp. FACHB-672]MBD2039783.1 transposase [Microcoleus sp. FACHB-672]